LSVNYQQVLVTGGAGFVGSNLAIWFKNRYPAINIIAADNLKRRGSETNLPRLQQHGVEFVHADIRNPEDLQFAGRKIDLILECSAEPSVLAGYGEAPHYLLNTNLVGTINCLELARRNQADFIFLSTSRVYPVQSLNRIETVETETRFALLQSQTITGVSRHGISENFPLEGARSLYGTTKLSSELLIQEYGAMYGLPYLINRCGVLTGPWQMGKVDQGVFALWLAMHYFKRELSYIGWGGTGKQVRDLLHIADLTDLLDIQIANFDKLGGQVYNVGGGVASSLSLLETTSICQEITGQIIPVRSVVDNRPADLKLYITDNSQVTAATGWQPKRTPQETLSDIYDWIRANENQVRRIFAS
jgi:CDP-paratose 2-epimerase